MVFAGSNKEFISRAFLMSALGFCLIFAASAAIAEEAPLPLQIFPERADLGEISTGSVTQLDFLIKNSGSTAVNLRYIFAECDCSLTMVDHGQVAAGGSFVLHAELTAPDTGHQEFHETITILTNHAFQKELMIPVRAIITQSKPTTSEVLLGG